MGDRRALELLGGLRPLFASRELPVGTDAPRCTDSALALRRSGGPLLADRRWDAVLTALGVADASVRIVVRNQDFFADVRCAGMQLPAATRAHAHRAAASVCLVVCIY